MNWVKQGLIFSPSGQRSWMGTHASLPVSLRLTGDLFRIYFATRDEQNRSQVGYVELDISAPANILRISADRALCLGPLGHFDDHGVYAASLVEYRQELYLYYIGWNPGVRKPLFYSAIGLAVSDDKGITFRKVSSVPIVGRSEFDPCLVTSPCVILDGGIWRMWYVSGFKWERKGQSLHSYYDIKYGESTDGIQWERNGLVCINLFPGERNIARPCVIKDNGIYKMWYSYNDGQGYRLGYSESSDGYVWARMDNRVGIDVSPSGWDSNSLAYPWVFTHSGRKYLLYNGNDFGREGFGLAIEDLRI